MSSFAPTPLTTLHRTPSRGSYDRALVYSMFDETLVVHVGFGVDAQAFVLPMAFARIEVGGPASGLARERSPGVAEGRRS